MMMFLHSTNYIHAVVIRYTDDEWSGNILFLFKLGIFYEAPADRGGGGGGIITEKYLSKYFTFMNFHLFCLIRVASRQSFCCSFFFVLFEFVFFLWPTSLYLGPYIKNCKRL